MGLGQAQITCSYNGQSSTCTVVVNEVAYVEISTAEQFISAMVSEDGEIYKLVDDIVITDSSLDANSTFQSGQYCFDSDFNGYLNGNHKKIIFNIENTSRGTTFYGVFKTISGTIVNLNMIIYLQTYCQTEDCGILAQSLTGKIDRSMIQYENYFSTNDGYPSFILSMGANAEFSRSVIYRMREKAKVCDFQVVKNVYESTKLTNVMILGDSWGWASPHEIASQSINSLPRTKCNVNGFYYFVKDNYSGVFANLQTGKYSLKLNQDKYANPNTSPNVSMAGTVITSDEMYVSLDNNESANAIDFLGILGVRCQLILPDVYKAIYNSNNSINRVESFQPMLIDFWVV
jgi:hypothetical protein